MGKYPENWEKDVPHIEVLEIDRIPSELRVGQKYHCTWASHPGMVWVLKSVYLKQATLETPRTKKIITTNVDFLRHINKDALQRAKKRIKDGNNSI